MTPPSRSERLTRAARLIAPLGLLVAVPKCIVCIAAYLGVAAALGLGGRELCGAASGDGPLIGTLPAAAGVALVAVIAAFRAHARRRGAGCARPR